MKIIALTGLPGSGKTVVSRILEEKGFARVRFGDVTDDEIRKRGLEFNEKNEASIRNELRETHGMEAYAKLSVPRIEKHENAVLDGVYSWDEVVFLRERYGDQMILVLVDAKPETRYGRLGNREVRGLSAEDAKARDKSQIEKLNMQKSLDNADVIVMNEGDMEVLKREIEEKLLKP